MAPASTSRCRGGTASSSSCEREEQHHVKPQIIAIVVAVVVVLGAVVFVTAARRSDVRGAGALSRRDPPARPDAESRLPAAPTRPRPSSAPPSTRGRPAPGSRRRDRAAPCAVGRRPTPRRSASAGGSSSTAPTVALMSAGIGGFAAASFVAFLWPSASGRLRRQGQRRQARRHQRRHPPATAASSTLPEARTWITEYPADALPKAEAIYADSDATRAWRHGLVALYQKCPHLGCRVPECVSSRSGSSARATARSTTGSARRRAARRRAAWTASPITVDAGGNVTVDTGTVVHRPGRSAPTPPAKRPKARTASRGGARALMLAARRRPRSPGSSSSIILLGWIVYAFAQPHAARARARLGDRAGAEPQAVLRRRGARGPAPRARAVPRRAAARRHRHRPAAVLDLRAEPHGRRDRADAKHRSIGWGERPVRAHGRRRLQLRRLPRRHERHRRQRRRTPSPTRSPARSSRSTWNAPALNTVLLPLRRDEVAFIIVYGRPFSPMSPWGLDGGGPLNEQQIETLIAYIEIDPDPARGLRRRARTATRCCATGHLPAEDAGRRSTRPPQRAVEDGKYEHARRGAVQPRSRQRRATSCARCHTQGWSYGDPGEPGQGAFGWNLTGGAVDAHFPTTEDMIDFVNERLRVRRRVRHARVRAAAACRRSARMLTDEQIKAIVEYVRSL